MISLSIANSRLKILTGFLALLVMHASMPVSAGKKKQPVIPNAGQSEVSQDDDESLTAPPLKKAATGSTSPNSHEQEISPASELLAEKDKGKITEETSQESRGENSARQEAALGSDIKTDGEKSKCESLIERAKAQAQREVEAARKAKKRVFEPDFANESDKLKPLFYENSVSKEQERINYRELVEAAKIILFNQSTAKVLSVTEWAEVTQLLKGSGEIDVFELEELQVLKQKVSFPDVILNGKRVIWSGGRVIPEARYVEEHEHYLDLMNYMKPGFEKQLMQYSLEDYRDIKVPLSGWEDSMLTELPEEIPIKFKSAGEKQLTWEKISDEYYRYFRLNYPGNPDANIRIRIYYNPSFPSYDYAEAHQLRIAAYLKNDFGKIRGNELIFVVDQRTGKGSTGTIEALPWEKLSAEKKSEYEQAAKRERILRPGVEEASDTVAPVSAEELYNMARKVKKFRKKETLVSQTCTAVIPVEGKVQTLTWSPSVEQIDEWTVSAGQVARVEEASSLSCAQDNFPRYERFTNMADDLSQIDFSKFFEVAKGFAEAQSITDFKERNERIEELKNLWTRPISEQGVEHHP